MASPGAAWLMVLLLYAAPEVHGVSPVQKVLTLIDEMAVKVKADVDAAVSEFETYSKFSEDSATEKEYALADSQKRIEALSAAISEATSSIDSHDSNIAGLGTKISGATKELDDAVALREKEHADFLVAEKQLISDVEAISVAVKETAFAQMTPDAQRGFNALTAGLAHVADAGFVMHARGAKVAAFLQAREDGEDEFAESNPQGGPLGTVQERSEAALKGARETESEESFAFSSLKMNLENEIKGLNKELAESTHGKQRSTEELAQSRKDLAVEKSGHADDVAFMQDLKRDFNSKARDFEVEYRDATGELKALGAAKAILEKKFASFLQASTMVRVATSASDDHKAAALRMIQQLGKRLHSTALVALAYRAAGDPFGKVRGMIEDMLAKLQQEAAEAATQEAFCNEERGKSMKSKEAKEQDLAKTNSRIEKAESAVAGLAEQITVLSKEIKDLDTEMSQATEIRNSERAAFTKIEKDLSESKDACSAATQVLRDYYENSASLLQVRAQEEDTTQGGGGILQVLEYAAADFEKQLSDERVAEREALSKFEKFVADSKMARAMKDVEAKSKQSETKSLKTSLNENSEDKEGTSAELQAVLAYLDELKPKCAASAPPSYAEKKARRESEIQGLKEALKTLE